jgi:hypothetical protein
MPSPDGPHMTDPECVASELRALIRNQNERTVAVSLPDEVATMRVMSFEKLPGRRSEIEALIRWRLQQETTYRFEQHRLLYRLYPAQPLIHVLAVLINEIALAQYESICEAAQLLPMAVSCETLQLFDLLQGALMSGDEYFFVHRGSTVVTFIAVRERAPVFLRRKTIKSEADVVPDIIGTLQYFRHQYAGSSGSTTVPLYLVDTTAASVSDGGPPAEPFSLTLSSLIRAAAVDIIPVRWPITGRVIGPSLMPGFFPALACVGRG